MRSEEVEGAGVGRLGDLLGMLSSGCGCVSIVGLSVQVLPEETMKPVKDGRICCRRKSKQLFWGDWEPEGKMPTKE